VTTLTEQIEAMRLRMNQLATEEHGLIRTLGDALTSADQRLLEEVRGVAAAHEARRGAILRELEALAGRMCILHRPEPFAALELDRQANQGPASEQPLADRPPTVSDIQDEIALHLRAQAHKRIA
jgi:hypothetical protein